MSDNDKWIWIDPAWDLGEIDPEGIAEFRDAPGGYGLEMRAGSNILQAFAPIILPIAKSVIRKLFS